MPEINVPPKFLEEIFANKQAARNRFANIPLLEKMEMAIQWHRDLTQLYSRVDETTTTAKLESEYQT